MPSLRGHLLIAAPKLVDPNFYRAVLLMIQHTEDGAMGLVLNRPTDACIRDIWSKVSDDPPLTDGPLFHGGPCEGPMMLLHTHEPASQLTVGKGLYFCAEEDQVRWLIEKDGGPVKAFIGYAGWSAGQLEAEIAAGSWLKTPATIKTALDRIPDWEKLIKKLTPGVINVKIVPSDPSNN